MPVKVLLRSKHPWLEIECLFLLQVHEEDHESHKEKEEDISGDEIEENEEDMVSENDRSDEELESEKEGFEGE